MPTFAGIHPEFDIAQYPTAIRSAIRIIAEDFYVTRSFKPIWIGNSQYWAAVARPTEEFSIYINTDRELVMLFSEYNTFEIRTLEAYDEVYSLLESKRADRSLRFLISADDRIESIIKHYLDQHPEYPIIVPTTFGGMKKGKNSLLGALRRNYLLRDLFGYQNPLREETFFFGRQNIVNSVLDLAKSGQNSSIFGLRKSGKTSAIYAIQRKARGMSCNVCMIDCQNPTVHARRYNELLSFLIAEIRKTLGQKKVSIEIPANEVEASTKFFDHMSMIMGGIKGHLLVIFDEIENISPRTASSPHWRSSRDTLLFWQIFRSFIQSEGKGKISICIVGTSPHIIEAAKINEVPNPIYLYTPKTFMPSLAFDEVRDMVGRLGYLMGLEFSVEVIAELHQDFGGHPFFTRQVCSKVHQLASTDRPIRVSKSALERAKTEFNGQLESYLRDIIIDLRDNYPEEFQILCAVVSGDRAEVNEFGRDAPDLIDHLIGYGLVERVGSDFDIRFEAIKRVLLKLVPSRAPIDNWAELSARRNAVEVAIRISLYHWSKTVAPEQWNALVKESLTEKRRAELSSYEPNYLFSRKESPLYFSDLIGLLRHNESMAYLSNKSRVLGYMDRVNKMR